MSFFHRIEVTELGWEELTDRQRPFWTTPANTSGPPTDANTVDASTCELGLCKSLEAN